MENRLKITLRADNKLKNTDLQQARVESLGELYIDEIIDKMFEDGLIANRDLVTEIVSLFNHKAAELTLSGYKVNTGLVKMTAEAKGAIYKRNWNPTTNKVDISLKTDTELIKAISRTSIEINEETTDLNKNDSIPFENEVVAKDLNATQMSIAYSNVDKDNPPCGVAFRRWLQNS